MFFGSTSRKFSLLNYGMIKIAWQIIKKIFRGNRNRERKLFINYYNFAPLPVAVFDIKCCMIAADAMHCQKETVIKDY